MYASRWTTLGAALALATTTGCATPGMVPSFSPRQDAAEVLEQHRAERAEQKTREEEARAATTKKAVPSAELLREGDRYRESNRYADAMFTYLRAARENPTELSPKLRIGFLHLRDEPGRSVRIFEALREEAPQSSELHAGLGLAHFALGAWQPAQRALSRAVELDPESAAARNALGVLLDRIGDGEAARDEYRSAHRLDPENAEILGNLGRSYLIGGEFELAAEALDHAAQIDPDAVELRNSLGVALGRQGRIDEAFAAFRAVGSEAQARNNLGYVYFLNGEHDLAMAEYESAIGVPADQLPSVLQNWQAARDAAERAEEQARLDALRPPVVEPPAIAAKPAANEGQPAANEEEPAVNLADQAEPASSPEPTLAEADPTDAGSTASAPPQPAEAELEATLAEIEREFRALVAQQDAEASQRSSIPATAPADAEEAAEVSPAESVVASATGEPAESVLASATGEPAETNAAPALEAVAVTEADLTPAESEVVAAEDVVAPAGATLVATGTTHPGPAPVSVLDAMAAVLEESDSVADEAPNDEASSAPAEAATAELTDPAPLDEAAAAL